MKQYKVNIRLKGGFGGLDEDRTEEKTVTCNELVRDLYHSNIVYADGRKIDFGWSEIINISVVE